MNVVSCSWDTIPVEVCLLIVKRLTVRDQARFARTSKKFYEISYDSSLEELQRRRFFTYLARGELVPEKIARAIRSIDLSLYLISPAKISLIENTFVSMNALYSLVLKGNFEYTIGHEEARIFSSILGHVTGLRKLVFARHGLEKRSDVPLVAEAIGKLTQLTTLDLNYGGLEDEGVGILARSLPQMVHLRYLNLRDNLIGLEGVQALAEALAQMPHLQELDLSLNQIYNEGVQILAKSLRHMTCLQKFHFEGASLGVAGIEALAGAFHAMGNLTELNFLDLKVEEKDLHAFANMLKHIYFLEKLSFSRSPLTPENVAIVVDALSCLPNFKELVIPGSSESNRVINPSLWKSPHLLKNLQKLELPNVNLQGVFLGELLRYMPKLTQLELRFCQIGDKGIQNLAEGLFHLGELRILNLFGNKMKDKGAKALSKAAAQWGKLELLGLDAAPQKRGGMQNWTALLHKLPQLKNLVFALGEAKVKITRKDEQELAAALTPMKNLDLLRIEGIFRDPEGVLEFIKILEDKIRLKHLILPDNTIGAEGARALAKVATKMVHLERLELAGNRIGKEGVYALVKTLQSFPYLKKLGLASNQIDDEALIGTSRGQIQPGLVHALYSLDSLKELDLEENFIGDVGMQDLAKALPSLVYLKKINFEKNRFRNTGAVALAEAFGRMLHLRKVDVIAGNPLGTRGARSLLQVIGRVRILDYLEASV